MTLSPVFRSQDAVRALIASGHFESLRPSVSAEREYTRALRELLNDVISERFLRNEDESDDDIEFLQDHFFLILFDSVFRSLECPPELRSCFGHLTGPCSPDASELPARYHSGRVGGELRRPLPKPLPKPQSCRPPARQDLLWGGPSAHFEQLWRVAVGLETWPGCRRTGSNRIHAACSGRP